MSLCRSPRCCWNHGGGDKIGSRVLADLLSSHADFAGTKTSVIALHTNIGQDSERSLNVDDDDDAGVKSGGNSFDHYKCIRIVWFECSDFLTPVFRISPKHMDK